MRDLRERHDEAKNTIDMPSRAQTNRTQLQATSTDGNRKGNGAPDSLSP